MCREEAKKKKVEETQYLLPWLKIAASLVFQTIFSILYLVEMEEVQIGWPATSWLNGLTVS